MFTKTATEIGYPPGSCWGAVLAPNLHPSPSDLLNNKETTCYKFAWTKRQGAHPLTETSALLERNLSHFEKLKDAKTISWLNPSKFQVCAQQQQQQRSAFNYDDLPQSNGLCQSKWNNNTTQLSTLGQSMSIPRMMKSCTALQLFSLTAVSNNYS